MHAKSSFYYILIARGAFGGVFMRRAMRSGAEVGGFIVLVKMHKKLAETLLKILLYFLLYIEKNFLTNGDKYSIIISA